MGMAAGAALLGPVGFVAGSIIGGSVAKSSMAKVAGDPKMEPRNNEDTQSLENKTYANTQQQPSSQVPDLLSYDNPPPQQWQQNSLQQNRQMQRPAPHNTGGPPATARQVNNSNNTQEGYRFGDISRGIIAKGKKADGRDDSSGYKFVSFFVALLRFICCKSIFILPVVFVP